ncbi:PREDICTED: uncharacterized protein LOC109244291 [Nicotiana attenuata]|uniref:uncharacterized protein LOC109244291 n=1 Tax=Nicotiana attenuata TaxID=49451 RepID=UPI0009056139|nr:PREDICTED: uncharacterized protein LOC109244291 [Nicotiana attenuata]
MEKNLAYASEYSLLANKQIFHNKVIRLNVKWERPRKGWIKANIDGAFKIDSLEGGIIGVFRDLKGRWMMGFLMKIQAASALHTELQALLHTLRLIIKEHMFPIEVDTDATKIINIINKDYHANDIIFQKCRLFVEEASRQGTILFKHSFREGNMVAHVLAKATLRNTSYNNLCTSVQLPDPVIDVYGKDQDGYVYARN